MGLPHNSYYFLFLKIGGAFKTTREVRYLCEILHIAPSDLEILARLSSACSLPLMKFRKFQTSRLTFSDPSGHACGSDIDYMDTVLYLWDYHAHYHTH